MRNPLFYVLIISMVVLGCTKIIMQVGGKLSTIDSPEKFYSSLGDNKSRAEILADNIQEYYRKIQKNSDYKSMVADYNSIRDKQNKLVTELSVKIKHGSDVKFENYEEKFAAISNEISSLESKFSGIETGFSSMNFDSIIIKASIAILKELGTKIIINEYSKKFEELYSILPFPEN